MDDIDRTEMVYRCNGQIVYRQKQLYFRRPKGHKTRTIPLTRGILNTLDTYVEQHPPVTITLPWAERDGKKTETVNLLITDSNDGAWQGQKFHADVWIKAFRTADTIYRNTDDGMQALRHLYASHMLAEGVSIKELAAYLGHSSEAFTLATYVHLMPASHDRARHALDNLFRPADNLCPGDTEAADDTS